MVQWFTLLPHNVEVAGLNPGQVSNLIDNLVLELTEGLKGRIWMDVCINGPDVARGAVVCPPLH